MNTVMNLLRKDSIPRSKLVNVSLSLSLSLSDCQILSYRLYIRLSRITQVHKKLPIFAAIFTFSFKEEQTDKGFIYITSTDIQIYMSILGSLVKKRKQKTPRLRAPSVNPANTLHSAVLSRRTMGNLTHTATRPPHFQQSIFNRSPSRYRKSGERYRIS